MNRFLATCCILALGVVAVVLVVRQGPSGPLRASVSASSLSAPLWTGGSPREHRWPGAMPIVADQALARAYAAVGQAAEGNAAALAHLDAAATERLEDARALWAATTLIHPGRMPTEAAAATGTAEAAHAGAAADPAAGPALGREGPPGTRVLDLSHAVDPATALRTTPQGPVLVAPGLWAKVAFDPTAQRQLVITDACQGGYGIAVYGSDFSTVRLDGGLVVPGQYYQVNGAAVLTGAARCSVDIRPLAALPSYAPAPARPPQSNG